MKWLLDHLSAFGRSYAPGRPARAAGPANLDQAAVLLGEVPDGQRAKDTADLEDAAVNYFKRTTAEAGFLTVEEAEGAAAAYGKDKSAWREVLVVEARHICREGLPVYAALAGPLEQGLDWTELPPGPYGDRLYNLRPHRFGFLPRLAMAALLGEKTPPALRATLDKWLAEVRQSAGRSGAYFSNLVVIYRLLAITWAAPFLAASAMRGERESAAVCLQMFRILAGDIAHVMPRVGQSAPNNHLLADRFAAWFVASCHPALNPGGDPEALEQAWLEELGRQFQADGTNFEQSVHYHELGCEMALAYLIVSRRRGDRGPVPFLVGQMLRFQAALSDPKGNSFALGDAADDPLLPLDSAAAAPAAWRVLYRALVDGGFPATPDEATGAERAYWLLKCLEETGISPPAEPAASIDGLTAFPQGGYFALRDRDGADLALFRTGPAPGVPVHAGHAMSDLLSFYCNVAGHPLLEASGTYTYGGTGGAAGSGPRRARRYFTSPTAHNGVVLQGHDPWGVPQGRFRGADNGTRVDSRWKTLAGELVWCEGRLHESGPLDGYRRGVLQLPGRYTLVYDRLPALPDDAEVSFHWQLAPEASVEVLDGRRASVTVGNVAGFLCADSRMKDLACVSGREDPPAGWLSRRYGAVVAAPQLIYAVDAHLRDFAFLLRIAEDNEDPPSVDVLSGDRDGLLLELRQGSQHAVVCIGCFAGRNRRLAFDLDFEGDVLWLEQVEGKCVELRVLGLRALSSSELGLAITGERDVGSAAQMRRVESRLSSDGLDGRWEFAGDV